MDHLRIVNTEGLRRRLRLVFLGSMLVWVTAHTIAVVALTRWHAIGAVLAIGALGVLALEGAVLLALLTAVLWVAARGLACLQTTDGYVFFGLVPRAGERFTTRQTIAFAGIHATTQGLQAQLSPITVGRGRSRSGDACSASGVCDSWPQFQTAAQAEDSPDTVTTYPWTDLDVVAPRWCTLRVTVRSTQESLSFYTPVAHRVAHIADGLQDGRR